MREEQLLKVLCELMKNSRQSDRVLAKKLGVSQPTVTRARGKIEKEYMQEYALIPDFEKIGYEIVAITFITIRMSLTGEERLKAIERGKKWIQTQPNIIFSSICTGMGMNGMMISVHKTFSDYVEFTRRHRADWSDIVASHDSVIININKEHIVKPLSFSSLTEDIKACGISRQT